MSKRLWMALQAMRQVWFIATLYCIAAVLTALLGIMADPVIPEDLQDIIGRSAVDSLLTIIASSMLSVLVFSLNTLVQASTAAASNATPRAVGTILQDRTAQSALSTFLGAFIFSLVGLIALNTSLYGGGGRLVLFVVTIGVIVLIVVTLLRWINYLGHLGQVTKTITQVESAASPSMEAYRAAPCLHARTQQGSLPDGLVMIEHDEIGYLRFIDVPALNDIAEELDADIYVLERTGTFVTPGRHIAGLALQSGAKVDEETLNAVHEAFTIGAARSYDQDPLYGLTVLSQIAMRALSPGINDPGTAIDVIGNLVRIMAAGTPGEAEVHYERVVMPRIETDDFFDAAFTGISRDGADKVEVGLRLQHAFESLSLLPFPGYGESARIYSAQALERARAMLDFENDIKRLEAMARKGRLTD
ncbi:hypothetical protein TM49_08120 [Martelella endophytica]|uniref:DUF2254 domain-containing protein n=2 Tax=Martelella endophytica TaxID=1486262 RepID=A0A0D5LX84_MAREN|nr:hypothetical protein TM49_08120 [Martelella endophytica]